MNTSSNMTGEVSKEEFQVVVQLVDTYLNEKIRNHILTGWVRIIDCKLKTMGKKCFSRESFGQKNLQIKRNPQNSLESNKKQNKKTNKYKYETQITNTDQTQKKQQQDAQQQEFQDLVMKKIQFLQQSLSKITSSASSVRNQSSSRSRSFKMKTNVEGYKFKLNPKYIPMREKMKEIKSFICESDNNRYERSQEFTEQNQNYKNNEFETPKVKSKLKGSSILHDYTREKTWGKQSKYPANIYPNASYSKANQKDNEKLTLYRYARPAYHLSGNIIYRGEKNEVMPQKKYTNTSTITKQPYNYTSLLNKQKTIKRRLLTKESDQK